MWSHFSADFLDADCLLTFEPSYGFYSSEEISASEASQSNFRKAPWHCPCPRTSKESVGCGLLRRSTVVSRREASMSVKSTRVSSACFSPLSGSLQIYLSWCPCLYAWQRNGFVNALLTHCSMLSSLPSLLQAVSNS